MINIKIEKEVKTENKVLLGLNLRQLCCVAIGVFSCVAIYQYSGLSIDELVVPFAAIGTVCGAFGWIEKDGMMIEDYIKRYMEKLVYHNDRLTYKTQNRYVKMYNEGKIVQRNVQSKDKTYQKEQKKKMNKVKNYKSKIKSYT